MEIEEISWIEELERSSKAELSTQVGDGSNSAKTTPII